MSGDIASFVMPVLTADISGSAVEPWRSGPKVVNALVAGIAAMAVTMAGSSTDPPSQTVIIITPPTALLTGSSKEWWEAGIPPTAKKIYTATLGGERLPISSVQYNLQKDGRSYLSVVVPGAPAVSTSILDGIGAQLVISQGYEYADGSRQTSEMVSTTLASVRADLGSSSASATLYGSGNVEFSFDPTVRKEIKKWSYLSRQANGDFRVRSSPVFGLFPGDSVWIERAFHLVKSINVTLTSRLQSMEIVCSKAQVNTIYRLQTNTNQEITGF